MARNIKLNSTEWCDLVFEGKNKAYGAYELRMTSSKRYFAAFLVTLVFVGAVTAIPSFLDAVKPQRDNLGGIDYVMTMSTMMNPEIPEENIIRQDIAPPPPPMRATIQLTPPVIMEDSRVKEEREMKAIDEILEKKDLQISFVTNESGSTDNTAVSPDELRTNKVIIADKEPEKPFISVEQMPQYPGGDTELMRFIGNNLKYPTIAAENGIEGRVVIRFVVTKEGKVTDVQVARSLDPSCDKEAIRVVNSMSKWVPGMQNGRNVAVYYTLPILFRLQK